MKDRSPCKTESNTYSVYTPAYAVPASAATCCSGRSDYGSFWCRGGRSSDCGDDGLVGLMVPVDWRGGLRFNGVESG
ncbi:unnamed protein product [Aspergillus oryzae var. brunneus]|uniref:Unnamed protein product n=2 Tax=Aspergillus oryzae TaxID=5062 RepID=A0AAN4YBG7_ASPOZ|nr:unnamed protein product [Aspergillus oryzae]GMG25114.1 unnamed protein product [Aspergillus oryzae]GMG44997.1 unnamed protein product [Aspergillus oryzae var. brunneus]